jgi:hypothetical protein
MFCCRNVACYARAPRLMLTFLAQELVRTLSKDCYFSEAFPDWNQKDLGWAICMRFKRFRKDFVGNHLRRVSYG